MSLSNFGFIFAVGIFALSGFSFFLNNQYSDQRFTLGSQAILELQHAVAASEHQRAFVGPPAPGGERALASK